MFGSDEIETVTVPLDYHDDVLGVFNVFVRRPGHLRSRGHHGAAADHRQPSAWRSPSSVRMSRRGAVDRRGAHRARPRIAPNCCADPGRALRFQVRMLEDTLKQDHASPVANDLQRIRNGLDEAHTELRELLNSFRAPIDQRGLVAALEKVAEQRFHQESGIHSFQKVLRLQILRIVQEASAVPSTAQAQHVRIMFSLPAGLASSCWSRLPARASRIPGGGELCRSSIACRSWRSGRNASAVSSRVSGRGYAGRVAPPAGS